jgi:hypothetical protein
LETEDGPASQSTMKLETHDTMQAVEVIRTDLNEASNMEKWQHLMTSAEFRRGQARRLVRLT